MNYGLKLDADSIEKINTGVKLTSSRLTRRKIFNMFSKPRILSEPDLPNYISELEKSETKHSLKV